MTLYINFQKALSGIQSGCQKNCTLTKLDESSCNDNNQLDKLETKEFHSDTYYHHSATTPPWQFAFIYSG